MDTYGQILVVDDYAMNRLKLSRFLEQQGHRVVSAENGRQAVELIEQKSFDLMLLDIEMPEMDGYQVLDYMRQHDLLPNLPVIVISALDEMESVIKCIEMGAEDHLPKPFDTVLLNARISACLEKKRLRDKEQEYLKIIEAEKQKTEELLLNILPEPIAKRLKDGESTIADQYDNVTVLFADIADFTAFSAKMSPQKLVTLLNQIFLLFDELVEKYGLEKIKTIGDAYMVVGGLPTPCQDHGEAIAEMALAMREKIAQLNEEIDENVNIRIGIATGPVIAGVIGMKKFSYDLWGDTVNIASRMESHGVVGKIQVTTATYELLKNHYVFEKRGMIPIKGKGELETYLLIGR